MRIFLTGATGFLGGAVVGKLRSRGDDVVALVRSPDKAAGLADAGCTLVEGSLADEAVIRTAMQGADAVVHGAAVYDVGVPMRKRPAMWTTNVDGTETVLRAALDLGVPRVVYVSTVGVFGNTGGGVVDESYKHPHDHFLSYYEETKVEAHDRALALAAEGLPLLIVQPGMIYGPGDSSQLGDLVDRAVRGRLPLLPFGELGVAPVHVDDVAAGIVRVLDSGRIGQAYVLAGEPTNLAEIVRTACGLAGRRAPRSALPTWMVRAAAPFGEVVGPMLGFPPNLRELVASSDRVTFWASSAKARHELGWSPRPLEAGLREVVASASAMSR